MKRTCTLFSFVLIFGLIGCSGPSQVNVKGKVTYAGKSVKYGEVVVFGSDGQPITVKINGDGTYMATGVASGECKFAVRAIHPKEVPDPKREKKSPDPEDLKNWMNIPGSYGDPSTSGLAAKLTARENEHNLDLNQKAN